MPTITARISDELAERLEPLKRNISVSIVCREALERVVKTHEVIAQAISEGDGIQALVQRLKFEQDERTSRSYTEGQTDGYDWAIRDAGFKELFQWSQQMGNFRPPNNKSEEEQSVQVNGETLFYVSFPEIPSARERLSDKEYMTTWEEESYAVGFKNAIAEVWTQIQDQILVDDLLPEHVEANNEEEK